MATMSSKRFLYACKTGLTNGYICAKYTSAHISQQHTIVVAQRVWESLHNGETPSRYCHTNLTQCSSPMKEKHWTHSTWVTTKLHTISPKPFPSPCLFSKRNHLWNLFPLFLSNKIKNIDVQCIFSFLSNLYRHISYSFQHCKEQSAQPESHVVPSFSLCLSLSLCLLINYLQLVFLVSKHKYTHVQVTCVSIFVCVTSTKACVICHNVLFSISPVKPRFAFIYAELYIHVVMFTYFK